MRETRIDLAFINKKECTIRDKDGIHCHTSKWRKFICEDGSDDYVQIVENICVPYIQDCLEHDNRCHDAHNHHEKYECEIYKE